MANSSSKGFRRVRATHGRSAAAEDPVHETALSGFLRKNHDTAALLNLFRRFSVGNEAFDQMMRRVCVRALARSCGHGLRVGINVGLVHPETFDIGTGVVIGDQTIIQGRFDGSCRIGTGVWIGPQSYFDARDLTIDDHVGWGPGAKVLGSMHTGIPADIPIVATDLEIKPVHIRRWADIGVNAIIMPGITVGEGAMVGAGAVVTHHVPPYSKVAGVPARVIGQRPGRSRKASAKQKRR